MRQYEKELSARMSFNLSAVSFVATGLFPNVGPGPVAPRISSAAQREIVESQAGVHFTNTTLNRYLDPSRTVSASDLRRAIATEGVADAQGAAGATTHYTSILKNGKNYNLKVVYQAESNTIYHFHYSRQAMGPLPKIKK